MENKTTFEEEYQKVYDRVRAFIEDKPSLDRLLKPGYDYLYKSLFNFYLLISGVSKINLSLVKNNYLEELTIKKEFSLENIPNLRELLYDLDKLMFSHYEENPFYE